MVLHTTNSVLSLKKSCLKKAAKTILATARSGKQKGLNLVRLPFELSEELFEFSIGETCAEEVDRVLNFFLKAPDKTPLRQICLRNARQADSNLIFELVKANVESLKHLDVRGCRALPRKFWPVLQRASKLTALKITDLATPLQCPQLEVLVIDWKPKNVVQRVQHHLQHMFYDNLLASVLRHLTYLDLSWCPWAKRLRTLKNATSLQALILRNCDISGLVDDISHLSELRVLDISIGLEQNLNEVFKGNYSNPDYILRKLVTSLAKLEYLDISGTNLVPASGLESLNKILEMRQNKPLQFLGLYSSVVPNELNQLRNIPAVHVAGGWNAESLIETIKRNVDMPKTLRNQITKLRSVGDPIDINMLLGIQIEMLKNLRMNEDFRFWALKTLNNFFGQIENPIEHITRQTCKELFLVLNRLNHFPSDFEKVSELSLRFTFEIFLKLLPVEEIKDEGINKEIIRLATFLVALNRTNFKYFKTEAILFRLLHRLSLERTVCTYLAENSVIPSCFEFFTTIQVYLGFSLSVPQTAEIVTITWESILNFMRSSKQAVFDFVKYRGLKWMYAHLTWFPYDDNTQQRLRTIFSPMLIILDRYLTSRPKINYARNQSSVCPTLDLLNKIKEAVQTHRPNEDNQVPRIR